MRRRVQRHLVSLSIFLAAAAMIDRLLVAEAELRADEVEPAAAPAAPVQPAAPEVVVRGRSGTFSRLPPRAARSPEERAARAAELRTTYRQPPEKWPPPHVDEG